MKRIIRYLKKLQDRRLRRFCIKCAIKVCRGTGKSVDYEADWIYYFLTGPHNDK